MPKPRKTLHHRTAAGELREAVALYSAGILEPERASELDRHLEAGCAVCASELQAFQETAAQLAYSLPERKPPTSLRGRLMDRIAPKAATRVLVRANEGAWQPAGVPGVALRRLFVDETTGYVTSLVKLDAGAVYPAHRHFGLEHCYVIEGDLVFHDHVLEAGDYEVALPSTAHSTVSSVHGCVLLLTSSQRNEIIPA
ncbi:MAG TPA: cupin domain-containing protein [Bryobacteraceae bacterium]|jgi:anti-sigma factor ChrR (cupin superfamily)|nr:cupin domain-containing protein [Bryobacteraceae bacterium]